MWLLNRDQQQSWRGRVTGENHGDQQVVGRLECSLRQTGLARVLLVTDRAVQSEPQQLPCQRGLLNLLASSPPGQLRDASCIFISHRCILSLSPSKPKKIGSGPLTGKQCRKLARFFGNTEVASRETGPVLSHRARGMLRGCHGDLWVGCL